MRLLILLSCVASIWAADQRTAIDWLKHVESEQQLEISPKIKQLQLAVGVYLTHRQAQASIKRTRFPKSAEALLQYMEEGGRDALHQLAEEGFPLNEAKTYDPERLLLLGVYIKYGSGHSNPKKKHAALYLDHALQFSAEQTKAAAEFYKKLVNEGQLALKRAYVEQGLSLSDFDLIRQYRIACATKGVGECFLPFHLGLHPDYLTGIPRGAGHGVGSIQKGAIGKPIPDIAMQKLESVRKRDHYSDLPQVEYGYRYPLLPDGIKEFLEPMPGYEPGPQVKGKPTMQLKDAFKGASVQDGQESLQGLVQDKPVLLFINDAVDAPLTRAIEMMPTLMKAWREHYDWRFIQVNIHDWFYASNAFKDYLEPPRWYNQHHAWSEEERARRISMRLVQFPQNDNMRIFVDSKHHSVKNRLSSGGGQNSFWLVGTDGLIKYHCGGPFIPMQICNNIEFAMSRLKAGAGVKCAPANQQLCHVPADPRVVVKGLVVRSINDDQLRVDWETEQGTQALDLQLTAHPRISVNGVIKSIDDIRQGDVLQVYTRLSDLAVRDFTMPAIERGKRESAIVEERVGEAVLSLKRICENYRSDADLLMLSAASGLKHVKVCKVQVDQTAKKNKPGYLWANGHVLWRGGVVTHIDPTRQVLRLKAWGKLTDHLTGINILQQWKEHDYAVHLDASTQKRHALVKEWSSDGDEIEVFINDFAFMTINGQFSGRFKDVIVGDRLTLRYRLSDAEISPLPVDFIRISRP